MNSLPSHITLIIQSTNIQTAVDTAITFSIFNYHVNIILVLKNVSHHNEVLNTLSTMLAHLDNTYFYHFALESKSDKLETLNNLSIKKNQRQIQKIIQNSQHVLSF